MPEISKTFLSCAIKNQRISHAYLFAGPDALLLLEEAKSFASKLNGDTSTEKMSRGIDPDVLIIKADGATIKIEAIRETAIFARTGPVISPYKVIIIDKADLMAEAAANAFLKTLEEPANSVIFILTTTRQSKLLRTIVSRCQQLYFSEEAEIKDENAKMIATKLYEVPNMDMAQVMELSGVINDDEDPEKLLIRAIDYYVNMAKQTDVKRLPDLKHIFGALRGMARHANKRLNLDNMLISLKEANKNKTSGNKAA